MRTWSSEDNVRALGRRIRNPSLNALSLRGAKYFKMGFGFALRAKLDHLLEETGFAIANAFRRPNLYDLKSPERIGCIFREPSDMCPTDRILLYGLVRGLQPRYAVEIGVRWGNSARIITAAMEENRIGRLVGIDPNVASFRAKPAELFGRYQLIKGYSPAAIPEAVNALGTSRIDFALIDGLHTHDAVRDDLLALLPLLSDGAHVLLHDTYHQGIDRAVRSVCAQDQKLFDCGFLTRSPAVDSPNAYGGFRLLRHGEVDSEGLITEAYLRDRKAAPVFSAEYWNRDVYTDRTKQKA